MARHCDLLAPFLFEAVQNCTDLAKVNTLLGRISDLTIEIVAFECDDKDATILCLAGVYKAPGKWPGSREDTDFSRHVRLRADRLSGTIQIV